MLITVGVGVEWRSAAVLDTPLAPLTTTHPIGAGHAMARTHSKPGPKPRPIEDRFWERVTKASEDDCWLWTGCIAGQMGYGTLALPGRKRIYAHRLSWQIANKVPVPAGMLVLHNCDVPLCVNPHHLRVGTAKDNAHDAIVRGRAADATLTAHPGESNGRAKITAEDATEIRRAFLAAPRKTRIRRGALAAIASRYGITTQMVRYIGLSKNWAAAASRET